MADIAGRVLAHIQRYGMFSSGQRVGVAVSGGADSMCLLYLLRELGPQWNLRLSVLHMEHGIRGPASREDAEFVRKIAEELGLPLHLCAADVPGMGGNLEQAARQARHDFFQQLTASGVVDRIATGHTGSDQAETVLYRIFRGAGLSGLSGIRPVSNNGLVRPLLPLWRSEIEDWLRERAITWTEDLSNQDLTYARNRLRHETLPMLRQAFNPNLDQTLTHMAVLAQDEETFWNETADSSAGVEGPPGGPVILPVAALSEVPVALARRQIRRALELVKGDLRQIDFGHVETVLNMACASLMPNQGHSRAQLPGLDVIRSFEWVRVAKAGFDSAIARDFEFAIEVPGCAALPGDAHVTFELVEQAGARESYDTVKDEVDWKRLLSISAQGANGNQYASSCLVDLRNWRPGDHYQPAGRSHDYKIKTLFQESRIPLWERRHWPVVISAGKILWAKHFGVAADLCATPASIQRLKIRTS